MSNNLLGDNYIQYEWRLIEEAEMTEEIAQNASYIITGPPNDERDFTILKINENATKIVMHFEPTNSEMIITFMDPTIDSIKGLDPVSLTRKLVQTFEEGSLVLIDITSLCVQAIFILLLELHRISIPLNVFASYVIPKTYNLGTRSSRIPDYILSERVDTIKAIPGFAQEYDRDKAMLFVTLGFEGGRFLQIQQYFENDRNIRPILPLPSYHAGWHGITLKGNIDIIDDTRSAAVLERFPAIDPFRIVKYLQKWHDDHSARSMVVAPIGTKPHALGVALLAVNNKDVVVVYDHPIPKSSRSSDVDKIWCFCLTGLI